MLDHHNMPGMGGGAGAAPPAQPPRPDGRVEASIAIEKEFGAQRTQLERNSRGTAAVVDGNLLKKRGKTFSLDAPLLSDVSNFCNRQTFINQPFGAVATAFLVAPDVILTASHNLPNGENSLLRLRFVFGFQVNGSKVVTKFGEDDVYKGTNIIARRRDGSVDWALVRLDRNVVDRAPLPCRKSGKIGDTDKVYVIGHPLGIPQKIAGNSAIKNNKPADAFYAELDAFRGNSGSPVFNASTNEVEGMLVGGPLDISSTPQGNCIVEHSCDGRCKGEFVLRITRIPFRKLLR